MAGTTSSTSDPQAAAPSYRVGDPEEFARNMFKLFEEGGRVVNHMLSRQDG
jgi:hypothetical protein